MNEFCDQGIVLQTVPFRDHDVIASVFTAQHGLVKLFIRGNFKKSRQHHALSPLVHGEFLFKQGRNELMSCQSTKITHSFLQLRNDWKTLQAACRIIKSVEESQLPGKPSHSLYQVLFYYLSHLHEAEDVHCLTSSFLLKLLKHEGVLHFPPLCSICEQHITDAWIYEGMMYCREHAVFGSTSLSSQELENAKRLSEERKFQNLLNYKIKEDFSKKIERIFTGFQHCQN
jgi:DNA repair protein RecO (recombination protein O)